MQTLRRDHCVFTGKNDLEHLKTYARFPVFMGSVTHPQSEDLVTDMSWSISRGSGSIQLNPLLPLDILYPEQHAEAVGQVWAEHHKSFANFLASFSPRRVFEIGAAHGILCRNVQAIKPETEWTILEPNPRIVEGARAEVIRGFFSESFQYSKPFDVVTHSHVFEHIYYPSAFMEQLAGFIPVGKYLIFSVPNMMAQLKSFYTNCLNFEHTYFLIEPYLEVLLRRSGFKLVKRQPFLEHSLFYAAVRVDEKSREPYPDLYEQNKRLFLNFVAHYEREVTALNSRISQAKTPVYLFGAHIFSQYLLHNGLHADKIVSILDNARGSHGKRLYGTRFRVESPQVLKGLGPANVILKVGAYASEIKTDILQNINPDVTFWE